MCLTSLCFFFYFFLSSRRRHTRCALVTGVQTCALPIYSDLIISKREIETTVTVDDGEILALGGLLDDNERKTIERIPLLSDIPGLGEQIGRASCRERVCQYV